MCCSVLQHMNRFVPSNFTIARVANATVVPPTKLDDIARMLTTTTTSTMMMLRIEGKTSNENGRMYHLFFSELACVVFARARIRGAKSVNHHRKLLLMMMLLNT